MQRESFKTLFILSLSTLLHSKVSAQLKVTVEKPDRIDSINLSVTNKVVDLLEQQKVSKATSYFSFKSASDKSIITKQLEKLSKDIQPIKLKTKKLLQTSFKNYKDSFNIDQVIYYNEEGSFYLFEFFFLKKDPTSKVVEIFIKDPAVLEKKRKDINEFKKKNPNIPQPPQSIPPGVYIKERN